MPLQQWVRLPTGWIQSHGLQQFRWAGAERSDNTAALMLLIPLAHRADHQSGIARLTYDQLGVATGLSRAKISGGLSVLGMHGLIARDIEGRSTYQVCNYDPGRGWAKLPAKRLYVSDEIAAFSGFSPSTACRVRCS
jgi:DNA-binding transcriptional ArsR family regulator